MMSGFKMVLCLVAMPGPQPPLQVDHGVHSLVLQGASKIKAQIERLGFINLPHITILYMTHTIMVGLNIYIRFKHSASQLRN